MKVLIIKISLVTNTVFICVYNNPYGTALIWHVFKCLFCDFAKAISILLTKKKAFGYLF